ncbi:MAG: chromate transporter [Clostridiales bacterium]|nr:chromate transporter [Clostridiales bacterium]
MILLQLFWEFFKTGLFAIGGGLATVPFLQDISAKTGWYTAGQLADMIAVSESTPGPMGVNMATYVGFTVGSQELGGPVMGIVAAITATLGLVAPSVIVIMIVAYFLKRFRSSKLVDGALYGLRPASVALISAAGVDIVLIAVLRVDSIYQVAQAALSWKALVLAALVYVSTHIKKLKNLHPIWFIAASAVIGVVLKMG